jgi:hypothetical protein
MFSEIAFMKSTIQRVLFAVTVTALGAGAMGTACAQTSAAAAAPGTAPPHHGHRGHFGRFGGSRFVGSLLRATKQLGKAPGTQSLALSTDQQTYIKGLLKSARGDRHPGTRQGPDITVIGNPTSNGFAAAVQNAQAAATARVQKDSALAQSIWADLSPGQQAAIPGLLASIRAQEQARRAQWAAKHTTGNG